MPDLDPSDAPMRREFRGGLPVGTRLGPYELKVIIGQGAFGITYRAHDIERDRLVAIKEYLPTGLALRDGRTTVIPRSTDVAEQFAWGRSRFLEEADTLKKLDGTPSVVGVHDFFEANGTAYMVMELIEGETLARRLVREERLAAGLVEPLLFPLLDGLEKVHAAGFLHRDIKPANIMIDVQGKPTLIDFGASRAALAGRTTTFTAIFTPGYAAVEQFASNKLRPSADIYGLAATLYHAIAGNAPPSAIERVLRDDYQPLVELQPAGYSMAFLESIDAALAVSSADRPQSVGEWRRMLASSLDATRIARSPGRLARAASRTRRARVSMGVPVVGLAATVGVVLLGAAGYFAFTTNTPPLTSPTVSTASAEELEQALAERRRADALAADKRRLEEEARQKAQAEADAQRQADEALEQTRQARQLAEQELAELNTRLDAQRRSNVDQASRAAGEAAQRKAEQDAAALAEAEQRAAQKAADDAEAKRQADEALAKAEAERQRAEQEARQKAEVEQAALRQATEAAQQKAAEAESVKQAEQERLKAEAERAKAEADRQKAAAELKLRAEAEAAEKALRLDQPARERLQLALTSLGFDTRGSDGIFGLRSREMISAWQKARNQPVTGFLNTAQQQALLKEAASALAKLDEAKKAEEEAKARPPTTAPLATAAMATSPAQPTPASGAAPPGSTKYDGAYSGSTRAGAFSSQVIMSLQISNGRGTGTLASAGCSPSPFSLVVSDAGAVSGEGTLNCVVGASQFTGTVTIFGNMRQGIAFQARGGNVVRIVPERGHAAAVSTPAPASPDGLWRGTFACNSAIGSFGSETQEFTIKLEMQIANGSGVWKKTGSPSASGETVEMKVSVGPSGVSVDRAFYHAFQSRRASISGQYDGNTIRATGREVQSGRECTLALTRA